MDPRKILLGDTAIAAYKELHCLTPPAQLQ
jgi:hypothetical protein